MYFDSEEFLKLSIDLIHNHSHSDNLQQKSTVLGNKETLLAIYCQVLTMYAQTFRLIYVIWECKHVPLSVFDDDIVLLLCPRDPPDTGLYTVVLDYRKLNHGQTFVTLKLINKNSGVVWRWDWGTCINDQKSIGSKSPLECVIFVLVHLFATDKLYWSSKSDL